MAQQTIDKILTTLREEFARMFGERLAGVYLYGSQARGDATPTSDIDLLIVLDGDFSYPEMLDKTLDLVAALSLEYDVVISRAFVSRERFEYENSPFLMNVRREAIPL